MPLHERFLSFDVGGERCHGMLHLPEGEGPHPAVLMLHGFMGHRLESHRLFVLFSRQLAAAGIASYRFDFRGSGESEGDFIDMTPSREVEDALHAFATLCKQPEIDVTRLGLHGFSMGGMIAAQLVRELAASESRPRALALWAPAHPSVWLGPLPAGSNAEEIRSSVRMLPDEFLPTGITRHPGLDGVDWAGNPVNVEFFADLVNFTPLEAVQAHRGPSLVVHGNADTMVPVSIGKAYADALGTPLQVINGSRHTFDNLAAQTEVHRLSLEFFEHIKNVEPSQLVSVLSSPEEQAMAEE